MSSTSRRATQQRRDALVRLVERGVTGVDDLAASAGVSPSTVRRDLAWLQDDGRIARTYGGALARGRFHERSFDESEQLRREAKAAIAEVAADLVPEDATVFLDAGTTCLALARLLAHRGSRTVYTRGLEAAFHLAGAADVDVVILGGAVRPLSHGLVGPLTHLALDRLAIDVAFLGADAVDPHRGIGEPTLDETSVKERVAARASRVAVLADASKLGPADVVAWLPWDPSWTLVTDTTADPAVLEELAARGSSVLTPEERP